MSAAVLSPLMGPSASLMCIPRRDDDDSSMEEDDVSIPSLSMEASAMTMTTVEEVVVNNTAKTSHDNDRHNSTDSYTNSNTIEKDTQQQNLNQQEHNDDANDDSMSVDDQVSGDDNATPTETTKALVAETETEIETKETQGETDGETSTLSSSDTSQQQQEETQTTHDEFPHGGLMNLGNTCYLNSALQMLASLDCFVPDLALRESVEPELRDAVLDLFRKLKNNGNDNSSSYIDPSNLKQIIDEKTPLFIGYRQQDSHEFLTTLLDLLDEDYKPKKKSSEKEEDHEDNDNNNQDSSNSSEENQENDDEEQSEDKMDTSGEPSEEQADDNDELQEKEADDSVEQQQQPQESAAEQNEEKDDGDDNMDTTEDSLPKKARTEATMDQSPVIAPLRHISSLSELQPDDISQLLHGNTSAATTTQADTKHDANEGQTSTATNNPHKRKTEECCKLVGGRAVLPNNDTTMVELKQQNADDVSSLSKDNEDSIANSAAGTDNSMSSSNNDDATAISQQQEEEEHTPPPSPIDIAFTTQIRARLTCDSCKYTRTHIETYKHLSLDIISDDTNADQSTIEEGLRKFFANESRELKCEKCFFEKATFQKEIIQLPKALLLHLKRFIVNVSDDWTRVTYEKNQSNVEFPQELSIMDDDGCGDDCEDTCDVLKESLQPNTVVLPSLPAATSTKTSSTTPKYKLRSIVNHIGNSASCGHYTADGYVKTGTSPKNNNNDGRSWKRFNDSIVSDITHQDACEKTRKTAYMIMYELQQ